MKTQAQLEDDQTWAWQVYDNDSVIIDWDSGYPNYEDAKRAADQRMDDLLAEQSDDST